MPRYGSVDGFAIVDQTEWPVSEAVLQRDARQDAMYFGYLKPLNDHSLCAAMVHYTEQCGRPCVMYEFIIGALDGRSSAVCQGSCIRRGWFQSTFVFCGAESCDRLKCTGTFKVLVPILRFLLPSCVLHDLPIPPPKTIETIGW